MSERKQILDVQHIHMRFTSKGVCVRAVTDVSFTVNEGETIGIVGESGCGKTTLGRCIVRAYEPSEGEVFYTAEDGETVNFTKIDAKTMKKYRKEIQMIFQDPYSSLDPRMTVYDIIKEPLAANFPRMPKSEMDRRIMDIAAKVGLNTSYLMRYPHAFSGGQRQRIGIARALIMEPQFVVADEPISALDVSIRAQVLNLMKKFQEEKNLTYLFIAHDLSVVRFISDRIGVIYKGRIVEVAEAEELFNFPLHPYTHSLISAIPIPDPKLEKNKVLYTYDPSIHDYSEDKPEFVCIGYDHYVYGNKKEIAEYKAIREKGVPVKPITIRDPDAPVETHAQEAEGDEAAEKEFLIHPTHDTGSIWYMVLSFLLPILGLIAAFLFKKFHHTRNYKMCRKGAIAGLAVLAVILLVFLLLLWRVVA